MSKIEEYNIDKRINTWKTHYDNPIVDALTYGTIGNYKSQYTPTEILDMWNSFELHDYCAICCDLENEDCAYKINYGRHKFCSYKFNDEKLLNFLVFLGVDV